MCMLVFVMCCIAKLIVYLRCICFDIFLFVSFWFNFINFPNCEKGKCLQFSRQDMGYILSQPFFMWNNDLVFHIVLAICNSLVYFYWVQIKQTLTVILWFTPSSIRVTIKFCTLDPSYNWMNILIMVWINVKIRRMNGCWQ